MIFSKACEYGVKAAIFIAQQSSAGRRASLKEVSAEINSPEAFTSKILQKLVRKNVINSVKGATGGFEINTKELKHIRLLDIVKAIDDGFNENTCVLGLKTCSHQRPCPVHHRYRHAKSGLIAMLEQTSLLEMSNDLSKGITCLQL